LRAIVIGKQCHHNTICSDTIAVAENDDSSF